MLTPEELEAKRKELEERRRLKRERRRRRMLFYVFCVLLGLALLIGTAYWSYTNRFPSAIAPRAGEPDIENILVLGVDSGLSEGSRSDSILLLSVDKRNGSVAILAIPRDTRTRIPGRSGYERINVAHAIGGPTLAVRTVESLLGVAIDHYVRIDFAGFEALVDALGGVVIDVEKRMYYEDTAQGLKIDLQPGLQQLDGAKALQYVRYRADGLGDVAVVNPGTDEYAGRIERQLKFVRALIQQALSAKNVLNAPQLVDELRGVVASDLSVGEALSLLMAVKDVQASQIQTAVLPGTAETVGGASYWVMDPVKSQELVDRMIARKGNVVRVEVLNGNGVSGMASQVADRLRRQGFRVVAVGNADHFDYETTAVIPHRGASDSAEQVAKALGRSVATAEEPGFQPIYASDADVTVIVGRDYRI